MPIEVARLTAGRALVGAAADTQIGRGTSPVEAMSTGLVERNAAPLRLGAGGTDTLMQDRDTCQTGVPQNSITHHSNTPVLHHSA
jgi:hypothetical protein